MSGEYATSCSIQHKPDGTVVLSRVVKRTGLLQTSTLTLDTVARLRAQGFSLSNIRLNTLYPK